VRNPLLIAPAHEADLERLRQLLANARASLVRGYAAAVALLPYPAPASDAAVHAAYMAFRREVDAYNAEIYRANMDPIQLENWTILEPDSAARLDLVHRLGGVGFSNYPPIAEWYAAVKQRRSYGALFQSEAA
jgi:glutathione S-transferase